MFADPVSRSGHPLELLIEDIEEAAKAMEAVESSLAAVALAKVLSLRDWLLGEVRIAKPVGPSRYQVLDRLLKKARAQFDLIYSQTYKLLEAELQNTAVAMARHTRASFRAHLGQRLRFVLPKTQDLRSMVSQTVVSDSGRLVDLVERVGQNHFEDWRGRAVSAVTDGKPTAELLRRTETLFLDRPEIEAFEGTIQTASTRVQNQTRWNTYQQNPDLIQGVRALVTLDLRTTRDICVPRSGLVWDMRGRPIDHKIPYLGGPPWHYDCRTVILPHLVNDLPSEISGQKRAALAEPVSRHLDYEGWLKTQSEARQRAALGPNLLPLWKDGKFKFQDLVNAKGEGLKVREILEKFS